MKRFRKINAKPLLMSAVLIIAVIAVGCAIKKGGGKKNAETEEDIVNYLSSFGWEVELPPSAEKDVIIPVKFSEVYEQYNALQKKQGFDLMLYRGDTVKSYGFKVLNFPFAEGDVFANLLVFEGKIIGGDLSSYAMDGFMIGLDGETQMYE